MAVLASQELACDFVVVGGGLSGVCAAIAAAREGARVVLIQNRAVLGGNASSEVKMHIVGADCHGSRPGARETGLIEEFKLEDSARNPGRSYAQWDLLLYEKVVAEPNITLLLNTDCVGCEKDGAGRITAVRAVRQSTEDAFLVRAPFFADCSGDGRLGVEAGADFTVGREGRDQFGERLAPEKADRRTLGNSILFTARRADKPQPFFAPAWVRKFKKGDFRHRPIKSYEYGYWWLEWGGHLDTLKDNEVIRHELLRIALGIWDFIKNSGEHPDSANWILDWMGAIPGKRETRRFFGPHVLTEREVETGATFADQVAYGGWWIDLHPPMGIDAVDEAPCEQIHFPHLYGIPLSCLYSRNVPNLFLAGRLISATHVAFASTRVMATCAVVGQAVGTAAAMARERTGEGIGAIFTGETLKALQQRLIRNDAFLPGLRGEDPGDLARHSQVAASSESSGGTARQVIDGHTRELFPHLGLWADGGTHRWESAALPAWLELSWKTPVRISEIHLTFDSGLQRELILSSSDSTTKRVVRGPQPETASDYEVLLDGVSVARVSGNWQRKRIHRLERPVSASKLRVVVTATHGNPNARLFEVRAY